jgi:hypothetical protein
MILQTIEGHKHALEEENAALKGCIREVFARLQKMTHRL